MGGTPRVLVLSSDLGGGHDALASALRAEVLADHPDAAVVIDNGLRSASTELAELSREGYRLTVERQPWIYQVWYWILSATAIARIARWFAWRSLRNAILTRIDEFQPTVVVSTYPFLTAALGKMRRDGDVIVPAVGLLIDSGPHDVWIAPGIDLHVTMNPADCERAQDVWPRQRYYPPLHITAARPAVDERCRQRHNKLEARAAFDLPGNVPVVLVSGGSWGLSMPDEDLEALVRETDVHFAIACGSNERLHEHLTARFPSDRVTPIGYTKEMPMLLAACDVAILNAGGITCHECFALGTPVILYAPIAGHGRAAARALNDDGVATWARTRSDLLTALRSLGSPHTDLAKQALKAQAFQDLPPLAEVVLQAQRQTIPTGEAMSMRIARHTGRHLNLALALIVAAAIIVGLWTQRDAVATFDWHLTPTDLLISIALFSAGPLTQAVAFWLLLRLTGVPGAPFIHSLAVWSWSALARYVPGAILLFVVRVREGVKLTATRLQVLAASLYEQALAVAGAAILSALAFFVSVGKPPPAVAAGAVVAVIGVLAARPALLGGWLLNRTTLRERRLSTIPRGRGMALVLVLNGTGWLAAGTGATFAIQGLGGSNPDVAWVVAVYSCAWLVGFVTPFSPGGVGVREGVLAAFLAPSYGAGVAAALAVSLRVVHSIGDLTASGLIELAYRSSRIGPFHDVLKRFGPDHRD